MIKQFNKMFVMVFMIIFLHACSNYQIISPTYTKAFNEVYGLFESRKEIVTAEQVANIPYASMLVSFGSKSSSLLILESVYDNNRLWVSADNKLFFQRDNGKFYRTIGLPNNLYSIDVPDINYTEMIEQEEFNYLGYYSFRGPTLNNLKVNISAKNKGKTMVNVFGREKELILIEETLSSSSINWKAINKYWIDPEEGYVWKSIQNLSPKLPPLFIEVTKKPSS